MNTNTSKRNRNKNASIEVESITGTRDFYPETMIYQNYLFDKWKQVAKSYNYNEYMSPVVEEAELYKRKGGEEIVDQMYNFATPDNKQVALRPELTPSLVRMILKKYKHIALPIKWFSIGQCWRYETLSKGRFREHYQWNVDIAGISDITAEFELINIIVSFLKQVGLTSNDVVIKINSRKLLEDLIGSIVGDKFKEVCIIIDKMDKLGVAEIKKLLTELELDDTVIDAIINCISNKDITKLPDLESVKELLLLFNLCVDISDWIIFDPSVVRGLSYYTGVVFEVVDRENKMRAIAGGGRYDNLISTYSNTELPMCGFGFGDCVIMDLLESKGLLPKLKNKVDYLIVTMDNSLFIEANRIANRLRNKYTVEVLLKKKNLIQCFAYGSKICASKVILIGMKEWTDGNVVVKNLNDNTKNNGDIVSIESLYA